MLFLVELLSVIVFVASSAPGISDDWHHQAAKLQTSARLSGIVVPTLYTLELRLEEDWFTTNTFSGTATINLEITDEINATDSSTFQFHAKHLNFTSTALTKGKEVQNVEFSKIDPDSDLVTVVPKEKNLVADTDYVLKISYTGILSETDMVGFYKSTYVDDFKQTRYMAVTQFEEIHARRAFPCFDEPGFKTQFTLYITYPKQYRALTLTNGGSPSVDKENPNLVRVSFSKTAGKISTYILAFMVSEYVCKTANQTGTTPVQVCSKISAGDNSAQLALDAAPLIADLMGSFTNYSYSTINKPQLNLIAVPDFAPGAMENLGMITFRESYLLWDKNEASTRDKQKVITVISHEMSHQWFGDLVTLSWWSTMFLNEGFATYFEYHLAEMYEPDWQLTRQFVVEQVHPALSMDSSDASLPLSYNETNADYSSRKNDVSYNKGASVLRMIHHFLGLDKFKQGLQDYISNHTFGSVTPDDLWDALKTYATDLPTELKTIMDIWITTPNYPLLTVKAKGNNIIISQEEFLLSGEGKGTKWYVPITYSSSVDANFNKTSTKAWLTPKDSLTLNERNDWFVLNNQQVGFYRVHYEDTLLQKISNALKSDVNKIDEISRAQLIDDQLNLARAGKKSYSDVLSFLSFLKNDDSYYSWYAVFNNFDFLLKKTANENVRQALMKFLKEHMNKLYKSVPINEECSDHITCLKQMLVQEWACRLGVETCINTANDLFLAYQLDETQKINPNLRSTVYCSALRTGGDFNNKFRFLWDKYLKTKRATEKVTILKALGCVNDTMIRETYLGLLLNNPSQIKLQDAKYVFASIYSRDPQGVTDLLHFVIDNYSTINKIFGSSSTVKSLILTIADLVTSQQQVDTLTKFGKSENLDADIKETVQNALIKAAQSLEETAKIEGAFTKFFVLKSGASIQNFYFVNVICSLIGLLVFNFY